MNVWVLDFQSDDGDPYQSIHTSRLSARERLAERAIETSDPFPWPQLVADS